MPRPEREACPLPGTLGAPGMVQRGPCYSAPCPLVWWLPVRPDAAASALGQNGQCGPSAQPWKLLLLHLQKGHRAPAAPPEALLFALRSLLPAYTRAPLLQVGKALLTPHPAHPALLSFQEAGERNCSPSPRRSALVCPPAPSARAPSLLVCTRAPLVTFTLPCRLPVAPCLLL